MKLVLRITAILVSWLIAATAQAQPKYTIQVRELAAGDSAQVEIKETSVYRTKNVLEKEKDPGKFDEHTVNKHLLFTEWVLERAEAGKMPTKIKRVYDKAIVKESLAPKIPAERPYHGKTLLIEKKGAAYEFRIEGGDAIKDDPNLQGEFNGTDPEGTKKLFLPKGTVAEGESWKVDTKPLLAGLGKDEKIDIRKADGVSKLVKVYKKDGRLYGVIECTTELDVKVTSDEKKAKGQLTSDDHAKMKITYDGCVDGSVADGKLTLVMEFASVTVFRAPGEPSVTSHTNGTSTVEDSWKQLPKK